MVLIGILDPGGRNGWVVELAKMGKGKTYGQVEREMSMAHDANVRASTRLAHPPPWPFRIAAC